MGRFEEYEALKALAREVRQKHGVRTETLGLQVMRGVYRREGIHVDLWKHKLKKVQAAYMVVDGEAHVMLAGDQPAEPRLFSMAHELKHHYVDRDLARSPIGCLGQITYRSVPVIEIGANVFASEFLFPEQDFETWAGTIAAKGRCEPKHVVRMKRACPAKVSYAFIVKRLEHLRFIGDGEFDRVQFLNLEKEMFGDRYYIGRRR